METLGVVLRPAREGDFDRLLELYEAVAGEGQWIGGEAPVDRVGFERRFHSEFLESTEPATMLLAMADDRVVGNVGLRLERGVVDLGMMVAADWRGRGVGSMLMEAGVSWARGTGAHKLALYLWPHNVAARRLYDKFGFVEEGRLRRHYRRRNGELWDCVVMGLVFDETSPGRTVTGPGRPER